MENKKDKATPRPWKADFENATVISSDSEWPILSARYKPELRANAELIVRAVNCHEMLLEAVKNLLYIPESSSKHALAVEFAQNAITQAEGK